MVNCDVLHTAFQKLRTNKKRNLLPPSIKSKDGRMLIHPIKKTNQRIFEGKKNSIEM